MFRWFWLKGRKEQKGKSQRNANANKIHWGKNNSTIPKHCKCFPKSRKKKNVIGEKKKEGGLLLPSWLPWSNYYWSRVPFPKLPASPTSLPQSGSALLLPSEVTASWTTPSPQRSCRGPVNREMTSDTQWRLHGWTEQNEKLIPHYYVTRERPKIAFDRWVPLK